MCIHVMSKLAEICLAKYYHYWKILLRKKLQTLQKCVKKWRKKIPVLFLINILFYSWESSILYVGMLYHTLCNRVMCKKGNARPLGMKYCKHSCGIILWTIYLPTI